MCRRFARVSGPARHVWAAAVLCRRVPLYQAMYSMIARLAPALVGQGWRSGNSPLMAAKNDSAGALTLLYLSSCVLILFRAR